MTEDFDRAWFGVENSEGTADSVRRDPYGYAHERWEHHWGCALAEADAREPDRSKWICAGRPTKAAPRGEDHIWWADAAPEWVADYVDWRLDADWQPYVLPGGELAIELEVNTNFGEALVTNRLDRAEVMPSGELVILDVKTGSKVPEDHTQLGQYAVAFARVNGVRPSYGAYYMARQGGLSELFDLSTYTEELLDREYTTLHRIRSAGLYLASPGWGCKRCSVRDACVAVGGTDAGRYAGRNPDY